MKFRHHYSALAAAAVLATTAAAWAAGSTGTTDSAATAPNDAMAIGNARISLTQAIAAAEQQVGGKASRAEYEKSRNGWLYEVEVVADAKVFDVKVDADKGAVISSVEDKTEHEREHDDERD